jgi:hypothetical protein
MTGSPDGSAAQRHRGRRNQTASSSPPTAACRAAERRQLAAALAAMLAGRGGTVLLSGEPGSGKTYLATELAREAQSGGANVVWGRCWEGEGAPELWPWLQVIRSCVRAVDDAALRELIGPHGGELTALLAPLRATPAETLPASASPAARFRLFNAVAHFLDAYAQRAPLVVVLDDLHRADAAALLLLQFFTQEQRQRRILLLGTYRAPGAAPNRALLEAVLEASREPGTERMALAGLGAPEAGLLVEQTLGRAPAPGLLAPLLEWTGGNPLFLLECLRRLDGDGAAAPEALPIPAELRVLVEQRLALLADEHRDLLGRAVAAGSALPAAALAAAEDLGLVQRTGGAGEYRFTHGVVRAVLCAAGPAASAGPAVTAASPAPVSAPVVPLSAEPAPRPAPSHVFRREGEYWTIDYAGRTCRIRDAKGLGYVALLLRHPGEQVHVSQLISLGEEGGAASPALADPSVPVRRGLGDCGVVLDAPAKAAYRRRLAELDAEIEEAQAFHDSVRAARAQRERELVSDELSAAVGLGGRDRRTGSDVERARINVTRSVARVLERIAESHPELAQHLGRCLRTGTFCCYAPDATITGDWLT